MGIPTPVSRTLKRTNSDSVCAARATSPPGRVNLTALWIRFTSTCSRRGGSADTSVISWGFSSCRTRPARSTWARIRSAAESNKVAAGTALRCRGTCPDSMRESSRSSVAICVRASTSVSMRPRKRGAALGSSSAPSRKVSVSALREARGVRSSCDTFEIKSRRTVSSRRTRVRSCTSSRLPPVWRSGRTTSCRKRRRAGSSTDSSCASPVSWLRCQASTSWCWRNTSTTRRPTAGLVSKRRSMAGLANWICPLESAISTPSVILSRTAASLARSASTTEVCMRRASARVLTVLEKSSRAGRSSGRSLMVFSPFATERSRVA